MNKNGMVPGGFLLGSHLMSLIFSFILKKASKFWQYFKYILIRDLIKSEGVFLFSFFLFY